MLHRLFTLLSALLALLTLGCGSTVTYHYTVGVKPTYVYAPDGTLRGGHLTPDAVITIDWKGGRKTAVLSSLHEAKYLVFSERRQSHGMWGIEGGMKGFTVRVTKVGYKPWEADYRQYSQFVQDDEGDLHRMELIEMQPVGSNKPTTRAAGTP